MDMMKSEFERHTNSNVQNWTILPYTKLN